MPLPGMIVLVSFLAVGLGLWFWVLQPPSTARLPLAKKPEANSSVASAATGSLPENHPPVEIPAEVKGYITDLEQKAAAAPKDLQAWKTVAQVQYRAGQIDRGFLAKAEASFRHVIELDPKNLDALRGLGNVHFDREEYPAAVESYARYLELKPDDNGVRTDLGTMYLYDGDDDKAIAEYRKVIAREGGFYQAHFNLGIAYAKKGDTTQALEAFNKAKSLAPDDNTRSQIQAMIERTTGGGSEVAGTAGAAPRTLQGIVEQNLRTHPIVGPKVVKLEWPSPSSGRVLLDNFPMQGMPEMVRTKFLDRLKSQLTDAKRKTETAGAVELQLVDNATGQVMATVAAQ
jgi:tetratricopeptide (TPR) repeat protein